MINHNRTRSGSFPIWTLTQMCSKSRPIIQIPSGPIWNSWLPDWIHRYIAWRVRMLGQLQASTKSSDSNNQLGLKLTGIGPNLDYFPMQSWTISKPKAAPIIKKEPRRPLWIFSTILLNVPLWRFSTLCSLPKLQIRASMESQHAVIVS